MQNPLVSIIIPVFNADRFLQETIESALGQTWISCELIIVDDHSSDDSWKVATSFLQPGLLVVKNQGQGAAAARNLGIRLAKGDYLQFLDADDLLAPEKIESQLLVLKDSPARSIASCAWGRFSQNSTEARFVEQPVWQHYPEAWKWLLESWLGGGMMQTACWLVPRAVVEDAGPWNESLASNPNDDGEYFSRVLLKSGGVVFCPVKGVLYRSSLSSSLSRRANDRALESVCLTCELYEEHVKAAKLESAFQKALRMNYLNFIYQHYPSRKDLIRRAWCNVIRLGGADSEVVGGAMFQKISRPIGFMNALRLRSFVRALGGRKQSMRDE